MSASLAFEQAKIRVQDLHDDPIAEGNTDLEYVEGCCCIMF